MSSYHARALSLKRLGNSLVTQFYATGKIEALDEAIATDQDAIALMRDKLQGRAEIYPNLGTALFSRFEQLGALEDLDDAFEAIGNARKQPPPWSSKVPRVAEPPCQLSSVAFWTQVVLMRNVRLDITDEANYSDACSGMAICLIDYSI